MSTGSRRRIRVITGLLLLVALVYVSKLYWIQGVKADEYKVRADRQHLFPSGGLFDRGSISFETKDGQLLSAATLKTGFTVAVDPSKMESAKDVVSGLSAVIEFDADEYEKKIALSSSRNVEVAKRVKEETANLVAKQKIPGVSVVKERWRYYPAGKSAAHIIGFVGYDGDGLSGRYGLERYYEDILSRDFSDSPYKNFFAEIFSETKKAAKTGGLDGDLVITIEPNVETTLEKELAAILATWSSDSVGGIIIDPKNGDIVAMASLPSFDPNLYGDEKDASVFSNPLVERVYEMGSIIKPLTMSVGLDTGAVTAETTYNDPGSLTMDGKTISNFDGRGRGAVNMQEVLNQSLNTGAVFVQNRVGREVFVGYFKDFGLGEETGIDLPGEVHGLIDNLDSKRAIELATASYGQGIALTPVATVRALSALGNGGYLITPHIVKYFSYDIGAKKSYVGEDKKRVLKAEVSEEISRMLVNVYDKALLEGKVKMPRYSIAAKTGTAQMAKEGGGGYYEDRYYHSFFGYFPAYNPKFLIFLYNLNPKGVRYSSETLTYPFVNLVKFLISYYEIAPDR